jgi:hypothetical protein
MRREKARGRTSSGILSTFQGGFLRRAYIGDGIAAESDDDAVGKVAGATRITAKSPIPFVQLPGMKVMPKLFDRTEASRERESKGEKRAGAGAGGRLSPRGGGVNTEVDLWESPTTSFMQYAHV